MPVTRSHKASGVTRTKAGAGNGKRTLSTSGTAGTNAKKSKYYVAQAGLEHGEADMFTPVKSIKTVNPKKILESMNTPNTPAATREMLTAARSATKPKRDTDALQLVDLKALKLDPDSYNSYLYIGKMTIPGTSVIAAQDQLRDSKSCFRVPVMANFDVSTSFSRSKASSMQIKGSRKGSAASDDNLSDFDYSDVEELEDSFNGSFTHGRGQFNGTLDLGSSLTVAAGGANGDSESESDAGDDDVDESGMQVVKIKKIRNPVEASLHDARVSRRQQVMAEEQRRCGIVSPNASFSKSAAGIVSPNASFSVENAGNTSSALISSSAQGYGLNVSSVEPAAPLQSQVLSVDARRAPFAGTATIPDRVVQVCVKYPLMGVKDEWKDSFQTLSEETDLYKSIETWRCPYLLRFYGTHGPGVVFEFVDGHALDEALAAGESETFRQEWYWSELGEHVSTALLYLHKRKISHNDLKPENVRYSNTKKMWKLLDLGLSTDIQALVCKNIGTDGYRAPEVAATGLLTFKSDVYGLGVMMQDAMHSVQRRYRMLEQFYSENKHLMGSSVGTTKTDVEELEDTILLGGKTWLELKQLMEEMVTRCLEAKPELRPSITRLVNFFISLRAKEKEVASAHHSLITNYL